MPISLEIFDPYFNLTFEVLQMILSPDGPNLDKSQTGETSIHNIPIIIYMVLASGLNLRSIQGAGRPRLNYDPSEKLWLLHHYVPKESIPTGGPVEAWPPGEIFPDYVHITVMIPVKFNCDKKGQPHLVKDVDPQYAYMHN
jgi:hypothetical protein